MQVIIFILTIALNCCLIAGTFGNETNKFDPSRIDFIKLNYLKIAPEDNFPLQIPESNIYTWQDFNKFNFKRNNTDLFRVRTKIELTDTLKFNSVPGIIPQMFVSAYEVYWDGRLIYQNGKIGSSIQNEIEGKFFEPVYLKEEQCLPGVHTIDLRISNFSSESNSSQGFIIFGSIVKIKEYITIWKIRFAFIIGIIFLSIIFNLFLFYNSKKYSYLLFSILCLMVLLSAVVNLYWTFYNAGTTYLDFQNRWLPIISIMIAILSPLFFLVEFSFKNKKNISGIIFFNLMIYFFFINTGYFNIAILFAQLLLTLVVIVFALIQKKDGSIIALSGIIISIIVYFLDIQTGINNQTVFSVVIILFYNFYLSKQFAVKERTEREAVIKSGRLENELLKKNINPHFLMNSLTSIIIWLKKDPEKAVKLVNALADEFRIVSQISHLKLIPVKQELDLCNAHIEIMNYRKGGKFCLLSEGIGEDDKAPPMIFHTLVENGITHGYENRSDGYFKLVKKEFQGYIQYTMFNDSCVEKTLEIKEGTGLKYVKARLEESYPGKWKLDYKPVNNGWEVNIEIRN